MYNRYNDMLPLERYMHIQQMRYRLKVVGRGHRIEIAIMLGVRL